MSAGSAATVPRLPQTAHGCRAAPRCLRRCGTTKKTPRMPFAPSYEDATLGNRLCSVCQKENKSFHSLTVTEEKIAGFSIPDSQRAKNPSRRFNRDPRAELLLSRTINVQLCNLFTGRGTRREACKATTAPPFPPAAVESVSTFICILQQDMTSQHRYLCEC